MIGAIVVFCAFGSRESSRVAGRVASCKGEGKRSVRARRGQLVGRIRTNSRDVETERTVAEQGAVRFTADDGICRHGCGAEEAESEEGLREHLFKGLRSKGKEVKAS